MRVEKKNIFNKTLTVSTQTIDIFDITNYSGFSATIQSPALAAGTMFLEWCGFASDNDADWTAVPTAQHPNASVAVVASGSAVINVPSLQVGLVRLRVTLSAGAGVYNFYTTAKDF